MEAVVVNVYEFGAVGDGEALDTAAINAAIETCSDQGGGHLISSYRSVPEIRESDGVYPDPPYIIPGTPPAYGFFCRHVQGLEFHNVQVGFESPDRRAALVCEDVRGLEIDGFEAERIPGSAPSVIIRE